MLTAFIALGLFGTILLFVQGCAALYRLIVSRKTVRTVERLQKWLVTESPVPPVEIVLRERLSDIPWLKTVLAGMRQFLPLRRMHRQADCRVPLGVFVLATPLAALGGMLAMLAMHQGVVSALLAAAVLGALPAGTLSWLKTRRMALVERQLPEALELVSRALRAGHAFSVGLKFVADESADPLAAEFRRVFDEVSMGVALPQALQDLTDRLDSLDMRFFVTSVLVQRETGGNLAEIIESLARLIRQRFELQLRVKALSAEGRLSAAVLFALPLIVGGVLYRLNPEYLSVLFTDPVGRNLLLAGSVFMVAGAAVMKRMVAIKI